MNAPPRPTRSAGVTPLPTAAPRPAAPAKPAPYELRPTRRSRVIAGVLRLGMYPVIHHVPGHAMSLRTARTTVDAAAMLLPGDGRVRVRRIHDPRVEDGPDRPAVAGEWVVPREAPDGRPPGAILYLHGGGYVVCSPRTHRPITSRLAADTGLPVLVPHYRLAPEHPFPAPLEDAVAAYEWLLRRGVPASGIVLAGDSAGGHLAAALTAEIVRTGLPNPAGTVLFSPWVDLTCELSVREQLTARDPYISATAARRVARLVVGSAGFDDPRLALLAAPWTGAPPVLIQVGGAEVLRPEAEALARAIGDAGGSCEIQVWNGQMHVFQILNRLTPEASTAMRETARFVRAVTATPAPGEAAVA
ncbi:alpha/beta hydrolase [Actinomadura atramentaria]|uniref:alpha/beta hydrolase n=1 Tax=Actinomadura atramentaria TaxID=1990 RepID=UPI000360CA33|nr:alpha/beta hydrolase [Actinomadura atramentaria]